MGDEDWTRRGFSELPGAFAALARLVEDGVFLLSGGGVVLDANPAACESLGRSRSDLIGLPVWEFAPDQTAETIAGHLQTILAGEPFELESVHRRADGSEFPVQIRIVSVDPGDEPRFTVVARDLSRQAALARMRVLSQTLVEASTAFMRSGKIGDLAAKLVDGAVEVTGAGLGALVATQGSRPELLALSSMSWSDPPGRSLYDSARAAIASGGSFKLDFGENLFTEVARSRQTLLANTPAGHPAWSGRLPAGHPPVDSFLGVPLVVGDECLGVLAVANKDVGFREEDEVALSALAAEGAMALDAARCAEKRQVEGDTLHRNQNLEALGRLAGGVAHDFNNLLTVISAHATFLCDRLAKDDARRADAEAIADSARRASDLTGQMLAFSRRQPLRPRVMDLGASVREVEPMLRRLLGEDIEIEVLIEDGVGLVEVDPAQLEQVVLNLSLNARDAMPEGGELTLECQNVALDESYRDTHPEVPPGCYVLLAVTDTGQGMDEETRRRIFEPFFSTKLAGRGTGLGLATVEGVVRQSGGFIWVYSEPGRGTTFKVYLPRVDKPLSEVEVPATPTALGAEGGQEVVLLVEDEAMVRNVASRILTEAGYEVLQAGDAEEALRLAAAKGESIDLLLTDVVMPKMSGRALADALAHTHPRTPVLYMSGYTDNAIVHRGVMEPEADLLHKPFSRLELLRKVREALGKPRPHDDS